jgi:hypothetical protein
MKYLFKAVIFIIVLLTFVGCLKNKLPENNERIEKIKEEGNDSIDWHNRVLEKWNNYNLLTIEGTERNLVKAEFKVFIADKTMEVYDFIDGKTSISIIEKGSKYLGFAVTRFKIEPIDKNWTWFLVVKIQDGERFWDGIIQISMAEFYEYISYNMLFLNCQYHEYSESIAVVNNSIDKKIGLIYFFDNVKNDIKIIDVEQIIPEELKNNYYISFNYIEKVDNNKFKFIISSDEILFGNLIWNVQTDEINIELIKPVNSITGREL